MVHYREATVGDIPAIIRSRADDQEAGPADGRMAAYLRGTHHPQLALLPRVIYVALQGDAVAGYIGGHLTRRFGCDGELQYLYVVPSVRRTGIATGLLGRLARWFAEHGALKICVNVNVESPAAVPFYSRHGAVALRPYWMAWQDVRVVSVDVGRSTLP